MLKISIFGLFSTRCGALMKRHQLAIIKTLFLPQNPHIRSPWRTLHFVCLSTLTLQKCLFRLRRILRRIHSYFDTGFYAEFAAESIAGTTSTSCRILLITANQRLLNFTHWKAYHERGKSMTDPCGWNGARSPDYEYQYEEKSKSNGWSAAFRGFFRCCLRTTKQLMGTDIPC